MIVSLLLLNVMVLMVYLLSDHHMSDTVFDTKESTESLCQSWDPVDGSMWVLPGK